MLKKLTLAIMGLSLGYQASAGTMGPACTPGNVTVPCETKQWDLGVQALYLRSLLDSDMAYGLLPNSTNVEQINLGWDWGYKIEGSYHFSTGSDLTMNWTHYSSDGSVGSFVGLAPDVIPIFPAALLPYQVFTTNLFDQVNLVMGQHVDMGLLKNARFYGGMQYADIRYDADENYSQLTPTMVAIGVTGLSQYRKSDFNGIGPVTGIDYSYDLMGGLSVTANGAASLLYGTSRFATGFLLSNGLIYASSYATRKAMVPGLEGKLGLNYSHEMAQGQVNAQIGFQALNYFNALDSSYLGLRIHNSDYSLYGPYFGVKWIGNA